MRLRPIFLFIASCFFFACQSALGKFLSAELHPTMVVFIRNAMSLIMCIPILCLHLREIKQLRFSKLLWIRGFISQIATTCWFIGISKVSLPSAMAFSFATPLFTTIAAVLFLNEKVSYRRGIALIIGFIGVLVILKPSGDIGSIAPYSWIIATIACWALVNIVVKKLSMSVSPTVIIFYMTTIMTLFSIPFAIIYWQMPPLSILPLVITISICSLLWQWFLIKAFAQSTLSTLQPFEFLKLIFASIIGYFAFNEVMPASGWVGVMLIITSSVYVTWREEVKKISKPPVI